MSRYYHNIEPSAFRPGQYVGYGQGKVWRITRFYGGWEARPQDGPGYLSARTLAELSAKLA